MAANSPRDNKANDKKKIFKFKCTFSGTVADAMRRRGWQKVDDDEWDLFWCDLNQLRDVFSSLTRQLDDNQRVGHFRNCMEISRKNLLVKNLKRLRYRLEKAFGKAEGDKCAFMPTTFVLPSEHKNFVQEFRNQPESLWIIKPAAGAQGRGILILSSMTDYFNWRQSFECPVDQNPTATGYNSSTSQFQTSKDASRFSSSVSTDVSKDPEANPVTDPFPDIPSDGIPGMVIPPDILLSEPLITQKPQADVSRNDAYVVQRYIKNPYLIGGRKFDIRFYVLVTSFNPLKAWVYREGFARFSAGQFSLEALQDVYIHLTNVAIQRTAEDYDPEKGSKWDLQSLREYLTARHGRDKVQRMMNLIDTICVRTLQSGNTSILQDRHCFEIYGFDVILDTDLYPWLLEVNASPAFTPSNEEDYKLKLGLIDDTTTILDLEGRLTGFEKRVGGFDLIWNDGPVYANPSDCGNAKGIDDGPKLNSYLGCENNRVPQLRDMYRNANFIKSTYQMFSSGAGYKSEAFYEEQNAYNLNLPKFPRKILDTRFRIPE